MKFIVAFFTEILVKGMFMLKKFALFAFALLLVHFPLLSQNLLGIQGKVIDKDTKDPLPAYISIKHTDIGSSADYDGTFNLILESVEIQDPMVLEVFQLGYKKQEVEAWIGENVLIEMELEPLPPHEVLVTADSLVAEEAIQTTVALKKMDIYTLPGTAADPIYSSQVLPGVNSLPDSSNMLIRGGSTDEVAYYFDGIEIANPFLTSSLHEAYFSIFDNQVIEGFRVSTSGYHTKYGDALSGVMDITAKDLLSTGEGGFGLSIMGLNSYVGLPIKNVGSFIASYNRGNSGLMTRINNRRESEFETEHAFVKLNINLNKKTNLRILGLRDNYNYAHDSGFSTRSRNIIAGLSLTSILSENIVSTFTLSRVSHQAVYDIPSTFKKEFNDNVFQARWENAIEFEKHYIEFGADIQRKKLDYFIVEPSFMDDADAIGTRFGLYFSDQMRVADKVYLTLGARINALSLNGSGLNFAPRFSLAYFITSKDILRFSGGFHNQYGDYFTLQQNDLRTKKAGHLSLTYDRISENLDLRVTLYNKEYWNLFLFQQDQINNKGLGYARGAELYVKRKHSKYDAFFVYNFLSSKRRENEVLFLTTSPYEINHSFTGIIQYKFNNGTLGIRFSYATGMPYTPLIGREWNEPNNVFLPIWGNPYSDRYPSYQRLDINGSKNFTIQKHMFVLYFGITNVLNRKNILRYDYSSDYSVRNDTYSIFGRSIFVGIYIPLF
jgi:hypothetical protein